jgi:hypothetical protein
MLLSHAIYQEAKSGVGRVCLQCEVVNCQKQPTLRTERKIMLKSQTAHLCMFTFLTSIHTPHTRTSREHRTVVLRQITLHVAMFTMESSPLASWHWCYYDTSVRLSLPICRLVQCLQISQDSLYVSCEPGVIWQGVPRFPWPSASYSS